MPFELSSHALGLGLSTGTLVLWSLSPFFFAAAGRRIGPYAVNLLRLGYAVPVLILICVTRALLGFSPHVGFGPWIWLALSGGVGLALGDFFLYRSLVEEGPELTSQIMTLSPALTAAMAWGVLREKLSAAQTFGMALVLAGVYLATWKPRRPSKAAPEDPAAGIALPPRKHGSYLASGIWAGIWSALCQAVGTVLAREAFLAEPALDAFAATAIRVGTGAAMLWIAGAFIGLPAGLFRWREPAVFKRVAAGTLAGPILGMLCYVSALKFTAAGIVTTITFMGPLLVIPLGAWRYGTRVTLRAALGTILSLVGVVFLGIG
jgi:drug/metabolite transporter (DMT)-like permease